MCFYSELYSPAQHHLPEVKDLINVYRALTRAAPSCGALIKYNKRTPAPKSEKKKVAEVLSDLMLLRHQHSTQKWGRVFWPQRLNNYQKPLRADSSDEEEDQDEVCSGSGWSSLSTNPWKASTPDPEEEAIKWESFDLLPELDHLELSMVNEVSEEEFHDALEVTARTPSPPPPGSTILIKSAEEPRGRCGLFRGTGQDQFGYINSNGDIFMVPHNSFCISATRIMVVYHFRWPEASVRITQDASLLIDEVLTRRENFPAFKIEATRIPTTYREAVVSDEEDLVEISVDIFSPEIVERANCIIH
ncbi:hypothetical protein GY45DRAFT_1341595 [Cubamyces sp. BRFM 1775]|nr:hypothetical protein GY45DRAFT_1341595 [Cubamyces sp. BRFM 1775]